MNTWRNMPKWIVWALFGAIISVFLVWGIKTPEDAGVGGVAAKVRGEAVTVRDYRFILKHNEERYASMFKSGMDESFRKQFNIPMMSLKSLVDRQIVNQEARAVGVLASDQSLRDIFTQDGKFSENLYESNRRAYNGSRGEFEDYIRKDLVQRQVFKAFEAAVIPTAIEVEKERELKKTKYELEFLSFNKATAISQMANSADEAKKYAGSPENKEKIKKYFESNPGEFSTPEQVNARHILIKAKKGAADEEGKAKEKLASIQKEIKTKSFEELAKTYSEDPGSKDKGGDLGWFSKGRMVPEFETAAFGAPSGTVSEPIQTAYGFHIIKVEGKKPAQKKTMDESLDGIAQKLLKDDKLDGLVKKAEGLLKSGSGDIEKLVKSLNPKAKWDSTGLFSLGEGYIPKIGESEELVGLLPSLSDSKKYVEKALTIGAEVYFVKFKRKEIDPLMTDKKVTEEITRSSAQAAFYSWLESVSKTAETGNEVWRNPNLTRDL